MERDLAALGLEVINQTFPDNVRARAAIWLPFLEELGADEQTVLIGHSSGAQAALRFAETHRVLGSVLVGVCHSDLGDVGERASGFYRDPWRWPEIRRHQQWIGIFLSIFMGCENVAPPAFMSARQVPVGASGRVATLNG